MDGGEPRGRRGGRAARHAPVQSDAATPDRAASYRHLVNPFTPLEVFPEEGIEAIHQASLTILRDLGMRVLHAEARQMLAAAGARVDEDERLVRFDPDMVMEAVALTPSSWTLRARNPARSVEIGGRALAVGTVGGTPNVSDLDRGRRPGTLADFEDFLRLAQTFDVIHLLGPATEPQDVPVPLRSYAFTRAQLLLTDKSPFVYSRGPKSVEQCFRLICAAHGIDRADLDQAVHCRTVVNANSPRQYDELMTQGILDFARAGQQIVITPFTLAGAMAPVTLAGALAQQNAEALAGIVIAQVARPGAKAVYGGFTSNVDMKSGAPAFGTPEYTKAAIASGQLARRYGLPWRSSMVNASNAPDAQAAYEGEMALWGAVMGGCNVLYHGAGWLEGGLVASFEKFVMDIEMLQMMAETFRPEPWDAAALALDAQREVAPGGHFFGAAHTLSRYGDAFYPPILSDWRNFETWSEDGARDAARRANRLYKRILADFEPPPTDPAVAEELDALIARFTEDGGAPPEM